MVVFQLGWFCSPKGHLGCLEAFMAITVGRAVGVLVGADYSTVHRTAFYCSISIICDFGIRSWNKPMRGVPLSEERENGLILNAIFMLCPPLGWPWCPGHSFLRKDASPISDNLEKCDILCIHLSPVKDSPCPLRGEGPAPGSATPRKERRSSRASQQGLPERSVEQEALEKGRAFMGLQLVCLGLTSWGSAQPRGALETPRLPYPDCRKAGHRGGQ